AFGDEGLIEDAPRGRPPRRTTEEEDLLIVAAFCDDPFMTKSFAEDHQPWGPSEWNEAVYTDEASFSSRFEQQHRVWRPVFWR
ncbi:hypothetical protein HPB47_023095, partial [Ixodes persulcatus]